tara:strand:+ start:499 stop:813 length:315 start_codon:yes stop_codon:yes gene_type:complete
LFQTEFHTLLPVLLHDRGPTEARKTVFPAFFPQPTLAILLEFKIPFPFLNAPVPNNLLPFPRREELAPSLATPAPPVTAAETTPPVIAPPIYALLLLSAQLPSP